MTTDGHLLTLVQWLSPAFPVGAFAYSHGLETAMAEGRITGAEALFDWLAAILSHGSGRNDAILLRAAHGAATAQELRAVDAMARAFAASAERLSETDLQGAAFCQTVSDVWGADLANLTYPVAVGAAAARMSLPADLTAALYLQAVIGNLVSVAVRAIPLGQTEGQAVLARLTPLCQTVADQTRDSTLDDLAGTAFLSDICAMRHETLQPRIFRT